MGTTPESKLSQPEETADTAGEAIYPGKEDWKNQPENRYTPEELREMARNWDIKIRPAKTTQRRRVG